MTCVKPHEGGILCNKVAKIIMPRNRKFVGALEAVGLTELEAQVYLYLLHHGPCGASRVYQALEFDKSSTYRLLDNLVEAGLVQQVGKGYGREFKVSEPNFVLELAKRKSSELSEAEQNIAELVTNLEDRAAEEYRSRNVQVYEWAASVRQIWQAQLAPGVKIVREIGTTSILAPHVENYQGFMQEIARQRAQKGIFLRSLVAEQDADLVIDQSSGELMREVRFLPQGFTLQAAVAVFGETTGFHYPKGERVRGVVLKDEIIASLVKSLFDQVWQVAE